MKVCCSYDRGKLATRHIPYGQRKMSVQYLLVFTCVVTYMYRLPNSFRKQDIFNQKVETAESKSYFLKRLRNVLILKTCFDVANIIVSYKIFEKPMDFITTRRNIHN